VYRFRAFKLGPSDLSRLHGIDERIAVTDYLRCVRFNVQLLSNSTR
jgi:carboxypeptidase PM20D1